MTVKLDTLLGQWADAKRFENMYGTDKPILIKEEIINEVLKSYRKNV